MKRIKKIVLKKIKYIFRPFAYKLGFIDSFKPDKDFGKNELIFNAFTNLKNKGFNPKLIVDIGANHGTWTRQTLNVFPDAEYILIEPQEWLEKSIEDLKIKNKIKFFPLGLGNKIEVLDFKINQSDDSSSFKPMNNDIKGYEFIDSIPVQMKTLDSFLLDEKLPIPNLIKIDAEGLDLEVLEGALSVLGKTEVILLEASVHQKSFPNSLIDVMKFMDDKGYELFDFTDLNRPFSDGLLWLLEVMFIKKNSQFGS